MGNIPIQCRNAKAFLALEFAPSNLKNRPLLIDDDDSDSALDVALFYNQIGPQTALAEESDPPFDKEQISYS